MMKKMMSSKDMKMQSSMSKKMKSQMKTMHSMSPTKKSKKKK